MQVDSDIASMFECQTCGSRCFHLMVQPELREQIQLFTNAHQELLIQVGKQPPFTADLAFMNRFATCQDCGSVGEWDYHFDDIDSHAVTDSEGTQTRLKPASLFKGRSGEKPASVTRRDNP